ncbi:cryptochrome-1-like [Ptychodera flava]|uniref:cryptochrome-1-like n=1 Tax=Ptychodera flava TaxID=63121 RepID=UPI00396A2640
MAVTVHWFRHGLRLHDNPSLLAALEDAEEFYPVFIFDGEVAGTKICGYNRWKFLHECLQDLDNQLKEVGGRLYVFQGDPCEIFSTLFQEWGVKRLCFEQDPEPIWQPRDNAVKKLCEDNDVEWIERISHTLWNPKDVINQNGGSPPVTYMIFRHVTDGLGPPDKPVNDPDFSSVKLPLPEKFQFELPCLEKLAPERVCEEKKINGWIGGEKRGLELFESRIKVEQKAFKAGYCLPNQYQPDLLGPPMSLSPYLRFGCVSVRKFYWKIMEVFNEVSTEEPSYQLIAQLIWREYFYTMSVGNDKYDQMKENPICLNIPWYENETHLKKWQEGETGYPWIDACMKQLKIEGWIHHVSRHAVSCFLTRGDLWISWEEGFKMFLEHLLDADWSICAGNWMWISSSAFERALQCPKCFCPVRYGRRMDPSGAYIRRYLPVLKDMPLRYLFEPWKAPKAVQEKANCIVGKDYPLPIVNHKEASKKNYEMMEEVVSCLKKCAIPHCAPSDESEVRSFVWLPDHLAAGGRGCTANDICDGIAGM